jgi:hypothetical protein
VILSRDPNAAMAAATAAATASTAGGPSDDDLATDSD